MGMDFYKMINGVALLPNKGRGNLGATGKVVVM
jgi:hypothetical protein